MIDKARAVLEAVGLAGKADELAANLSHGEQRNLEIGIALATEPQLLCLDEPTAGMSAAETHDTMELVRRIAEDLTILIVEHDMQVVMELATAITVLHYGEVLAEGTPAEIQAEPAGAGGLPQDVSSPRLRLSPRHVEESTPTTASATSCTASRLEVGAGRGGGAARAATASARAPRSRRVMGLVRPSQGEVRFEGRAITGLRAPPAGAPRHRATCRRTAASSGCSP